MDRKQEILMAANKSFSLFGYKATTMEQIAKIANVGKGTIYNFFENKEVLFQEIVLHMIEEMKLEAVNVIIEDAPFQQNAHAVEQAIVSFICEKINKYVKKGEIRQVNAELVAYLLLKAYVAFVNDWNLTHDDSLSEEDIANFFQDTIFRSLAI